MAGDLLAQMGLGTRGLPRGGGFAPAALLPAFARFLGRPLRPVSPGFLDPEVLRLTLGQTAEEYSSLVGGLLGLGLGPGGAAEAQKAWRPIIRRGLELTAHPALLRAGLFPYSRWMMGLQRALERSAPGMLSPAEYRRAAGAFLGAFGAPAAGAAAAGFFPSRRAAIYAMLAERGLVPGLAQRPRYYLPFIQNVLTGLAQLEEHYGRKASVEDLEKHIGPLSYWMQTPRSISVALRARLLRS